MNKALFLLLGLTLGVWLGYSFRGVFGPLTICLLAIVLLFSFLSFKKKQALFFLLSVGFGIAMGFLVLPIATGTREVSGIVIRTGENYYVIFAEFRRYYVYEKGHSRELGDILKIYGSVKEYARATYESRFDFGEYLHSLGVYGEISSRSIESIFDNPIRIRFLENSFLNGLDPNAKGLVGSALFGRKDYESDIISLADSMNLVFAVSSSGLIYGMMLRGIEKRLKWKLSDKASEAIVLAISVLFLPFGIAKIGIRRVFLMRLGSFINTFFLEEEIDALDRICFIGILMILLNRYEALQAGFLLGFGISIAFTVSAGYLRKYRGIKRFLLRYAMLRLFLIPITMVYCEGEIPLLSGLYTQLLIPINYLFTFFAAIIFFLSFAKPLLNPLGDGYYWLLKCLSNASPKLSLPPPNIVFIFLYYAVLFVAFAMIEAGFKKTPALLGVTFLSVYMASLAPWGVMLTDQISFINVGQGDSILIRDNGNVVLLDTGGNTTFDMAKEVVIPFLRKNGISHIDYLIASHGDFDHIGAKESLMERFEVRHFIDSHTDFPLDIGELHFESYNHFNMTEENDKSLVLSLDFMGKKWLFTGDAPSQVEKLIIAENPDLDCDILKAGHHGSDTSTCAEWLDAITPETAIISCGKNNSYGHPKPSVVRLLEDRGIKIRRTDVEGTITYRSFSPFWL